MSAMPSKYGNPTLVMIPPANGAFSTTSTRAPVRTADNAAAIPAHPAPQTSTSVEIVFRDFATGFGALQAWVAADAATLAAAVRTN